MSGRHRKPGRAGIGAAAIATSGAFAVVPMMMATGGTASAADAPGPPAPAPQPVAPAAPPVAAPAAVNTTAAAPATYTVKAGDTLSAIAAGRGTGWQSLWEANKSAVPNANMLHPGEQLRLPTAGPAAPGAAAPASLTGPVGPAAPATSPAPMVNRAKPSSVGSVAKAAQATPRKITTSKPVAKSLKPGGAIDVKPTAATKQMKIWLTGYSFQDNTPAGSATVSHPILHKDAGGTGTYADPITVAVPGQGSGIWKAGSRFYLPSVKRYVIVEDTGASPAPSGDAGHLDMWVDGQGGSKSASDACMDKITSESATAIFSPPSNLPVMPGPITQNGKCNVPT
jgi:LysM repeat protein